MNSVVINQYKRRNFIDEAVLSIPKEFEIVAVTDFEYKNCNVNVVLNDSAVGTRYKTGIEKASGDFIYLLDDDDFFLSVPPMPDQDTAVTKSAIGTIMLADVIRYHSDWHISQYCLRKDSAKSLPIAGINDSLDKVIFFHALGSGISLDPTEYVYKRKHRESKTSIMDKKEFYKNTARAFDRLLTEAKNGSQKEYAMYNISLNNFLAGDKREYGNIAHYLPFSRRLYYGVKAR